MRIVVLIALVHSTSSVRSSTFAFVLLVYCCFGLVIAQLVAQLAIDTGYYSTIIGSQLAIGGPVIGLWL